MRVILLFFFLVITTSLRGQKMEVVLDTSFSKYWMIGNSCIVKNDAKTYFFRNEQISEHDKIDALFMETSGYFGKTLGYHPFTSGDDLFLLDDSLGYDTLYKATLGKRSSYESQHLEVNGDYVGYIRNDSVFVNDFLTNTERFAMTGGTSLAINSRYLKIRKDYPQEHFIFLHRENKLVKLPEEFDLSSTHNGWMLIEYDYLKDAVIVKNTELEDVVNIGDGYNDYGVLPDLAIFTSARKKSLMFKQNREVDLNLDIADVNCYEEMGLCVFQTRRGKYGILDGNGRIIEKPIYDKIVKRLFKNEIFLKNGFRSKLIIGGEVVFEIDNADGIRYLCSDLYDVEFRNRHKLVRADGEVVLDLGTSEPFYRIQQKDYEIIVQVESPSLRSKMRKYTMWNVEGVKISQWVDQPGDTFCKSFFTSQKVNLKMCQNMKADHLEEVCPGGIVTFSEKIDEGEYRRYFMDTQGNILSGPFSVIHQLDRNGHFLVQTMSQKVGVVRYSLDQ